MLAVYIDTLRRTRCLFWLLVALGVTPGIALAHAVVYPKKSTPGGYEKYVLRVPNERDVPTLRIEIHFPPELRVGSFGDVPGWTLHELTDSAGRVTGAVWTGTLPPKRFIEFPFVGRNPKENVRLVWPAFQTYSNGERVDWIGPEGSKRPASATTLDADTGSGRTTRALSLAALIVGLVSLGISLRPTSTS
jgi:uncharacterized protein YcnI